MLVCKASLSIAMQISQPMERQHAPAVMGSSQDTDADPAGELLRDDNIWREMQEASRSTSTAVPQLVPQSTGHVPADTIDAATMRVGLKPQNLSICNSLTVYFSCTKHFGVMLALAVEKASSCKPGLQTGISG